MLQRTKSGSSLPNKHTNLLCVPTNQSITYTLTKTLTTMSEATFNFRLDTLMHEIEMHPYREELIELIREQVQDDTN